MTNVALPTPQLDDISDTYNITFAPETFSQIYERAPIHERIEILLNALSEKEIKLTSKKNLPVALVTKIISHRPDQSTRYIMSKTRQHNEDKYYIAQQVHILAEVAQIVQTTGQKMSFGPMYDAYRNASPADQYLYLLDQYEKINLGYFDGYQEEPITHETKILLIHLLRDHKRDWHTTREYLDWLIETYDGIKDWIEEVIVAHKILKKDPIEQFVGILNHRVISLYMIQFGLLEEQETTISHKPLATRKTALVDALMRPQTHRDTSNILTRKTLSQFVSRAKKFKFDDPFHTLAYGLSACVDIASCRPEEIAAAIIEKSDQPPVLQREERRYFVELFTDLRATIDYFLSPEPSDQEEQKKIMRSMKSFVLGLYHILPQKIPHAMFTTLLSAAWATDMTLKKYYDISIEDLHSTDHIEQRLSIDAKTHLLNFFAQLEEIDHSARKAKRINSKFKNLVQELLESFVLFHLTALLDLSDDKVTPNPSAPKNKIRIYQLRIDLMGTKPPIWRRIIISADATLYDLHCAIQKAMGWTNSHLHNFERSGVYYGEPSEDEYDDMMGTLNEKQHTVSELLYAPRDYLHYEYDFGDSWRHRIRLEKIFEPPADFSLYLPQCLKARGACPPEDIGGVPGYYDMLEQLSDPNNPRYKEYLEWLGGDFDPDAYDMNETNQKMLEGCPDTTTI